MDIRLNKTMPRDFVSLMLRSGNEPREARVATKAIKNSLCTVGMYKDKQLIAFARVVGDASLYYCICDVMIDKRIKSDKVGIVLFKEIDDYITTVASKDSQVLVIADKPFDEVCRKFGFKYLDSDFSVAMIR